MKRTNTIKLGYYEYGDQTSPTIEIQRWESIDAQLKSLFSVMGNGVLDGWTLIAGEGLSVSITPGTGHVAFVAVETSSSTIINGLTQSSRNYIYANLVADSYWTKNVGFGAYLSTSNDTSNSLYIGYVDTNQTKVTGVNIDNRLTLGFRTLIQQMISQHKHIGGTSNPSQIDLSSEVQGVLNQENLPPIDASLVQTGTLSADRVPEIDHLTKVINKGTLTHSQLDSLAETLYQSDKKLMGETSTINLLQLVLALKHVYPAIDEFLVNQISYIPGISPDDFVDWINTTATVDVRPASEGGQHTISGAQVSGLNLYAHVWDTADDYESSTSQHILIDGNTVTLSTKVNELILDEFSDLSQWKISTTDLSSVTVQVTADTSTFIIPPQSGKIVIGDKEVEVAMTIRKTFNPQDWTQYKYLSFYIKTDSVDHGDLYFYVNDSQFGIQNSYTLVLPRNTPTINLDTLENGWQEITLDISSLKRTSIDNLTFFMSTQNGWNTSKSFNFNIDNIVLKTGNVYESNGYIRVIFGSDFYYRFWKVRWDSIMPSDSEADGLVLKERNRVANSLVDLSSASWSDYASLSGTEILLPTDAMFKYIEIEMYFGASTTLNRAATLVKIYLDFFVNDSENSFSFDTIGDWESGSAYNIDTKSVPGSILVSQTGDIGNYYYGTDGSAGCLDPSFSDKYTTIGTSLPKSTYQALNSLPSSLGLVTGVQRGNNGNMWLSDIDNDRVVEMDRYGNLIRGFYGSFLSTPYDPYGIEENGPGSNTGTFGTESASTLDNITVLHSIYNSVSGILYIVFNNNLENIYSSATNLNMNKIYVKIGSQRIYLNKSEVSLLGVPKGQYDNWSAILKSLPDYSKYINQFSFKSHVLQINVSGADKTAFDYMVNQKLPTISIISPYEQRRMTVPDVKVEFSISNFLLGTGSGENSIRVRVDGGSWVKIYNNFISYSGLSNGKHTIDAQLVDSDDVPLTNIGAQVSSSFIIAYSYSLPLLSIISPVQNQICSSSPVSFEFSCINFPIMPSDQHLRYTVDDGTPVDLYSISPFTVYNLESGVHTLRLYTVDKNGDQLVYPYGDVSETFIVGYNPYATAKLYIDSGAIYDITGKIPVTTSRVFIDVGNITFANIYAPIDLQVIPSDAIGGGLPSVLIAKMRSPSWLDGLGNEARALELVTRKAKQVTLDTTGKIGSNVDLSAFTDVQLIYDTFYLNGHSVVQLDMNGNTIFSNNAAVFSSTKEIAKSILGSVEKLGASEVLIGDSINRRAIITYTDPNTQIPKIEFEYESDRFVVDFHIVPQQQRVIEIYDDSVSEENIYIRQGTSVTWVNKSSSPVTIYSGTTTYDQFYQDPELNRYGAIFKSSMLNVGESFTFTLTSTGNFDWFTYPDILTGEINVTEQRISSRDQFYVLESDGQETPFASRLIKIDSWGQVNWSFGEAFMVKPRDVRIMANGNVLLST